MAVKHRAFCDCGKKAEVARNNTFICVRCAALESRADAEKLPKPTKGIAGATDTYHVYRKGF